jgi:Ser-tRNA(Ala) deacylase AlaX
VTPTSGRSSDPGGEPLACGDASTRPTSGIARIRAFDSAGVILLGSPMCPSRPGLSGDHGTVGAVQVVDVLDDPRGQLHVLRTGQLLFHDINKVRVEVDVQRRMGIARANSLATMVTDALDRLRVPIESVEVVDARAWIVLGGPATEAWLRKTLMQIPAENARLVPADRAEPHVTTLAQLGRFTLRIVDECVELTLKDRGWAP